MFIDSARCLRLGTETSTEVKRRATFHGGLAQLARAPALQAGGQRFESVILHESLFGIEIFDILTHKTVVLNQKIRYFTSEDQSLRVLRHSQTYVAIIQ